jgi:hypothetical protein
MRRVSKVNDQVQAAEVSPALARVKAGDEPEVFADRFEANPNLLARKTSVEGHTGWFRLAGLAILRGKELVPPTLEQLQRLKEVIAQSEVPLYFVVEAAADNRIAEMTPFKTKKEWVAALKDHGVAGHHSFFESSTATKAGQLKIIDKLLAEAQRGL